MTLPNIARVLKQTPKLVFVLLPLISLRPWSAGCQVPGEAQLMSWSSLPREGSVLGKGHKSLQMMLHGDILWGSRKAPTLESSRNQGRIPGRCAIRNNSQEIVCPLAGLAWEQHEQSCVSSAMMMDAAGHEGTECLNLEQGLCG